MASLHTEKLATLNLEATWAKRLLDQIEFANREVFTILQIDVRLARRSNPTKELEGCDV